MDDMQLGDVDIAGMGGGKMALIDSGNTSIQIPASQFRHIMLLLQAKDRSVYVETIEEHEILRSRKLCVELYDIFDDLKFSLQNT